MKVGAANQPEAKRIDAERSLELEAAAQRMTQIAARRIRVRLGRQAQQLETGKFIRRREFGTRLARALVLSDLD